MKTKGSINEILSLLTPAVYKHLPVVDKNTELETDLNITGDDAEEFMYKYSEKFDVKLDDFKNDTYFSNENEIRFSPRLFSFLYKKMKKGKNKKRITVGDLIQGVEQGFLS